MKSQNIEIEDLLTQKRVKILKEIDLIRKRKGLSETALASKMAMDKSYLSRILHGSSHNITLETIAKAEYALGAPVLVTPNEYEDGLMDNLDRFVFLIDAVLKYNPAAKVKLLGYITAQTAVSNYTEALMLIEELEQAEQVTTNPLRSRWPTILESVVNIKKTQAPEACYG